MVYSFQRVGVILPVQCPVVLILSDTGGMMETPADDPAERAREADRLRRFRTGFYRCLSGWADTAFELCDAALCAPAPVASVPVLSLEPIFRRSHGSLYKALARGMLTPTRCATCWLNTAQPPGHWCSPWTHRPGRAATGRPAPSAGTTIPRPNTRPGSPSSPAGPTSGSRPWPGPTTPGPPPWTPAESRPEQMPLTPAVDQVRELLTRLGDTPGTPVFCFDAGYDPIAITHELAQVHTNIVVTDPRRQN